MRWMGGWSYGDLMECPRDYFEMIAEVANEEAKETRRAQQGHGRRR